MIKIRKLEIRDFRGINHLMIEFHENLNIFIGNNGAGKSAILDCTSIMLSRLIGKIQSAQGTGRFFTEHDISNSKAETQNIISVNFLGRDIEWNVTKTKTHHGKQSFTNLEQMKESVNAFNKRLITNPYENIPLAVYYPVNRVVINIPLRIRKTQGFDSPLIALDQALSGKRNDFRMFFEWFRNREDLENERRIDDNNYKDKQLESVRKAIESLLHDYSNLRVRRAPLRMTILKNNEELIINQLSDGEKCLLALVGDLAWRLAITNPNLDNPLYGNAIVLIDEIDLHLHPAWQRQIVPSLNRTFPNCQFVLTTHSPQILSHVSPSSIFGLKRMNGKTEMIRPEVSYGLDTNRILEDIMEVPERPFEIKKKISELFLIINKGDIPEAKRIMKDISEQIGNDPELVKAGVLIRRKESIGK